MKAFFTGTMRGRIVLNIVRNIQNAIFLKPGKIVGDASTLNAQKVYDYAKVVFDDYLNMLPEGKNSIQGKDILELGPGGNALVAYRLIHAGAKGVHSSDKYKFMFSESLQKTLWDKLAQEVNPDERLRNKHSMIYNCGVENLSEQYYKNSFDLIISRAVLEYVSDLSQAIDEMDKTLHPGGVMLHKIDFRDDGLFSDLGLSGLTRFTLPKWLYRCMTSHSYRPNHFLIDEYCSLLESKGYTVEVKVSYLLNNPVEIKPHVSWGELPEELKAAAITEVNKIKPTLSKAYKLREDRDWAIAGVFLIARKGFD